MKKSFQKPPLSKSFQDVAVQLRLDLSKFGLNPIEWSILPHKNQGHFLAFHESNSEYILVGATSDHTKHYHSWKFIRLIELTQSNKEKLRKLRSQLNYKS